MLTFWQRVRLAVILACFSGLTIASIVEGDVSGMIIFPACFVALGGAGLVLWIQYRRDHRDGERAAGSGHQRKVRL